MDSDDDEEIDITKFGSKKAFLEAKAKRKNELQAMKKDGKDVVMKLDADVFRLPNVVQKGHTIDPITGTAKQGKDVDAFMSPTSFL